MAPFPWNLSDERKKKLAKDWRTQLSSAPATMVACLLTTPLENVKTRMQSQDFPNAWQCAKYTYRAEGIKGFWAGAVPPLLSVTFVRVIGFSVYQKAKYRIDNTMKASGYPSFLDFVNTPGSMPTIMSSAAFFTAGASSGAAISTIACPFELVKTVSQTSALMGAQVVGTNIMDQPTRSSPRIGSAQAASMIYKRFGLVGFYTGYRLHAARDTIGSGIFFMVYENIKQTVRTIQGSNDPSPYGAAALGGVCCGVLSWIVTYPLDTMKTRAQSVLLGSSGKAAVATTFTSKLRGLEVSIARTALQNCLIMVAFEWAKKKINGLDVGEADSGSKAV